MSLPLIFDTRVETIPAEIPYLYANEWLVDYWREALAQDTNFKIGICWRGNERYRLHALKQCVKEKSISLAAFAPIARLEGVSLYNLQKMDSAEDITAVSNEFTVHTFADFDESNGRFMDTAAIIKNLDLVISVDTAICHLAGALGIPTWILLPKPADWRWLIEKTDTPWYPNTRLFRQRQPDDWESVIQKVVDALSAQLHGTLENLELHLPAEEVIDQITQPQRATRSPKRTQLEVDYQYYLEKYPALEQLVESLTHVNEELQELEHEFASLAFSVFDETCIEMARKACHAHDVKNHLKENIQEIICS